MHESSSLRLCYQDLVVTMRTNSFGTAPATWNKLSPRVVSTSLLLLLGFHYLLRETSALAHGQRLSLTVSTACFASPVRDLNKGVIQTVTGKLNDEEIDHQEEGREDNSTHDDHSTHVDDDTYQIISVKQLITVSSQIELPFSAEVAYDAYSNLTRQPSWSSWLDSVVLSEDNPKESRWTIKVMGLKYSWTAISPQNERPHTVQWRSVTGLRNFGTVRFERRGPSTLMTLKMSFVAPRAIAALFRKSQKLTHLVETMLEQSLRKFRDVVLEVDLQTLANTEGTPRNVD